jgi:thiol-disulfide isomerase/thioredoxin
MLRTVLVLLLILIAMPVRAEEVEPYKAPELTGLTDWFNTQDAKPQSLAALKGKVVLVDFWTYSCVNCLRTLPALKEWYSRYHDQGFEIIGVHSPEFDFEKDPVNVKRAIDRFTIPWPVALDNQMATWRAYKNRYWPAHYLIDRDGNVVYTHFGEGEYDVTEAMIRKLVDAKGDASAIKGQDIWGANQTPETYLGAKKQDRRVEAGAEMPLHSWAIDANWTQDDEHIIAMQAGATLKLHFNASKVFLVMAPTDDKPVTATISFDGKTEKSFGEDATGGKVTVDEARLYRLADFDKDTDGTISISADAPGLQIFAFTFESMPH